MKALVAPTLALALALALPMAACAPKAPPQTDPGPQVPMPAVGPLPSYDPPVVKQASLSFGASLWVVEDPLLPLVSVRLVIPGGSQWDPPERWGRSTLTAAMMEESAGGMSSIERSAALKLIAADLEVASDRESLAVGLDVGSARLAQGLTLMADAVLRPDLRQEDWDRVHRLHANALIARREDAPVVAAEVARLHYWGAQDPRGTPQDGTPVTAEAMTLEEVRAWHAQAVKPGGATFVVVGAVSLDEAKARLEEAFLGWEGVALAPPALPEHAPPAAMRLVLVDMPGAAQTAIRIQGPGFTAGDPMAPAAELAGTVIGGSFTSRLNNLLREQKGYTYGVGAGFGEASRWGNFVVGTSVRTDATAAALTDLLGVLSGADGPFSETEVAKAHAQLLGGAISPMETRAGVAGTFAGLAGLGLPPEHLGSAIQAGLGASEADMRRAAETWIDPAHMVVVLVGDEEAIAADLAAAGFTFEEGTVPP